MKADSLASHNYYSTYVVIICKLNLILEKNKFKHYFLIYKKVKEKATTNLLLILILYR